MLGAKGIWKLKQVHNPDPYSSETDRKKNLTDNKRKI